jgi:hypothetical protein
MQKLTSKWIYLTLVFALALATPAMANTTLVAGGTVTPPDSFTLAGTVVADTGVVSYTGIGGQLSGVAQTVVLSDPGNVFCAGCLDFAFAVFSNSSATTDIERISSGGFAGFLVDAGVATVACGLGPNVSPINADRSGDGSVVGYNFSPSGQVLPGDCSAILIIETNAVAFTVGTLQVIDSDVARITSFTATTPEPGSLLLLGSGILSLGGLLRRRILKA